MGLFNKLVGNADGIREQVLESFDAGVTQYRKIRSAEPRGFGLFNAVYRRYELKRWPLDEERMKGEIAPFLHMYGANAVMGLAEYMVWQEKPSEAREQWLRKLINDAAMSLKPGDLIDLGALAASGNLAWARLLDRETIAAITKALDEHR